MPGEELWQIYADNGAPIPGKGAPHDAFDADKSLNMGNSHIWFWKQSPDGTTQIMLQKRGPAKKRPGWYHISVGGHIHVGETALQAAVREVKEEVDLDINPEKLYFLQTTRMLGRAPHDMVNVYVYELGGDEVLTLSEGEVAGFEWLPVDDFKEMIKDPERHKLVPMGDLYFGALVAGLAYRVGQKF